MEDNEHWIERLQDLQRREQNVQDAEKKLNEREERLTEREEKLKKMELSLNEHEQQEPKIQSKDVKVRQHLKPNKKLKDAILGSAGMKCVESYLGTECIRGTELTETQFYRYFANSMKIIDNKWSNVKMPGILNLFPHDSNEKPWADGMHYPVELFRNLETNEFLWVDPSDSILPENKERIEFCLKKTGKEMSNCLFDFLSHWNYYCTIEPFVKQLMYPMAKFVDIGRRSSLSIESIHKFDNTPLMLAANVDAAEAVAKLIERGANLEAVEKVQGKTALYEAAISGYEKTCRVLIKNGANVNVQVKLTGSTPLMHVSATGIPRIVKILLNNGANTKIENHKGKTAIQESNFKDCTALIEAHELLKEN